MSTWKSLARIWQRPVSARRFLADERQCHFFAWFHLEPAGEPVPAPGGAWHCFRPEGPAFHALAEVAVRVDREGAIAAAVLGLDRTFIDGRNGAFARDIARSFLAWLLEPAARQRALPLIANIESLRALAAPVLVRGRLPEPPADTTGAYAVFTGERARATVPLNTAELTLANVAGPFPAADIFRAEPASGPLPPAPGWLRIDIGFSPPLWAR